MIIVLTLPMVALFAFSISKISVLIIAGCQKFMKRGCFGLRFHEKAVCPKIRAADLQRILAKYDKDASGTMNFQEFKTALVELMATTTGDPHAEMPSEGKLRALFFQACKDGEVDGAGLVTLSFTLSQMTMASSAASTAKQQLYLVLILTFGWTGSLAFLGRFETAHAPMLLV